MAMALQAPSAAARWRAAFDTGAALRLARRTLAGALVLVASTACKAEPQVVIETATGSHTFAVEIADDPSERSVGLMHRTELAPDRGMLFVYPGEQQIMMWMKNTLIPLDMVFIHGDGTVEKVARNAVPMSTETIPSGRPVLMVLEIAGGRAAAIGLKAGDRVLVPDGIAPEK